MSKLSRQQRLNLDESEKKVMAKLSNLSKGWKDKKAAKSQEGQQERSKLSDQQKKNLEKFEEAGMERLREAARKSRERKESSIFDFEAYCMSLIDGQITLHSEDGYPSPAEIIRSKWIDESWTDFVSESSNSMHLAEELMMNVESGWCECGRLVAMLPLEERKEIDFTQLVEYLYNFEMGWEDVDYVLSDRWGKPSESETKRTQ